MKFLLATVISSALVGTFAAAEPCTIPQLTKIMANEFTKPCMTGSGLDLTQLNGTPTQVQLTSFCKTSACTSFLKAVMAQNPPDCTLPMGNLQFRSQLFDPIEKFCSAVSSGAGAGAGNASAVTSTDVGNATTHSNTTAPAMNTTAPAVNTTGPAVNTTGPAANTTTITKPDTIVADTGDTSLTIDSQMEGSKDSMSAANSDTEPATSATTKVPTPSPSSGAASSFVVSACASALGVASLLWVL